MANEFRIKNGLITNGSATISGSVIATGNITAPQFIGTASAATYWSGSVKHVESASFAVSASWAPSQATASYALTASYVAGASAFPYTGSARISGSLHVSGSITSTGSVNIRGGFLNISGSITTTGSVRINGFMNIGPNILSSGSNSLAQGASDNKANGVNSHAQGQTNVATGLNSHAEGQNNTATGQSSHVEGGFNTAIGNYAHAEGIATTATGDSSHAEGSSTNATGEGSHAEGSTTQAIGINSHAEGDQTIANGGYSHAEGFTTEANGASSHAEGEFAWSNGSYSHAEGSYTMAQGYASHAEGTGTVTLGDYSHAEGNSTVTVSPYQHAQGTFNLAASGSGAFIIGNGDISTRSNLLFASGSQFNIAGAPSITGSLQVTGSINSILTPDLIGISQGISQSYDFGKQVIGGAYRDANITGSIAHTRMYGTADSRIGLTKGVLRIPAFGVSYPYEVAGMTVKSGTDYATVVSQYVGNATPGTQVLLSNVDNESFQTTINMDNANTNPTMQFRIYDTAAKLNELTIGKFTPGWQINNSMTNATMSLFRVTNNTNVSVFNVTQDNNVYNGKNASTWDTISDIRDKTNIQPISQGLDFINQIEAVSYDWNRRDGALVGKKQVGFVAQNVLAAQTGSVIADYLSLVSDANPDQLTLNQSDFIPLLVRAVQELSAEVTALKQQLNP